MKQLHHETINGKKARVAYLDKIGGKVVSPGEAKIALAVFEDGSREYLVPGGKDVRNTGTKS